MAPLQYALFPGIKTFVEGIDSTAIETNRKLILKDLTDFIRSKWLKGDDIRINFICTHNSRRSHFAQVWAQTLAHYFEIRNVFCYSGGTEATALFQMVAKTLKNVGFDIHSLSSGKNPVYMIKYALNAHPIIAFSKKYEDSFNPKTAFAAVMTCASANELCPYVPEVEKRIAITYEDPK